MKPVSPLGPCGLFKESVVQPLRYFSR